MKKLTAVILVIGILLLIPISANATKEIKPFDVEAKSAVLMDIESGKVLYAKNPDEALPPASVTKVMTLLLVMEEIDSGRMSLADSISVSEYASSMGGSQVFLEAGEEMSCEDMLKSVVVSSANDGAVALAEAVAGSEESFVKRMNERAAELGMKNTNFENVTGLDDDTKNHNISALDSAVVSRELVKNHPLILKYSSIWMDTIRNGQFGLSNTNRLIRFYKGATGLKTGSTSKAGFCISATAEREGMHLVAVIMGSETRDKRNEAAKKLLDWGFANYTVYSYKGGECEDVQVQKGKRSTVSTRSEDFIVLVNKKDKDKIEIKNEYVEKIKAPVKKGDELGTISFILDGKTVGEGTITAQENVAEIGYLDVLYRLFLGWLFR